MAKSIIDRFLFTNGRENLLNEIRQEVGVKACSNHFPLILDSAPVRRGPTPFRFENVWLDHSRFRTECETYKGNLNPRGWEGIKIMEKMKGMKVQLKRWNKKIFGDANLAKGEVLGRIEKVDSKEEVSALDENGRAERRALRNKLEEIVFKEAVAWK